MIIQKSGGFARGVVCVVLDVVLFAAALGLSALVYQATSNLAAAVLVELVSIFVIARQLSKILNRLDGTTVPDRELRYEVRSGWRLVVGGPVPRRRK